MSSTKKNVLIFIEPHPLRNTFTEFVDVGRLLATLLSSMDTTKVDWRLFSNESVLEELGKQSVPKDKLLVPTPDENGYINSCLAEWTIEEIDKRTLIINGEGDVSRFYEGVLERIRESYKFDVILLWSENGAVRRFADEAGVSVLHMELGPTRTPFQETAYVDYRGTNGSASFLEFDLTSYPAENVVPAESWIALSAAIEENKPSIMELQALKPSLPFSLKAPYIVVALQLADDLNTICHSSFRTPKEFLQFLLPKLLTLGFKVVVKGHPGSPARPINLVEEIAALEYARGLGEDVVVLERNLIPREFLPILSAATAVCSINSSVSFEALLLGVPGLVFGTAVYDIGSILRRASDAFVSSGTWSLTAFDVDRLVTVLCRHLLHPKDPQTLASILQQVILRINPTVTPEQYSSMLFSIASHGYSVIDEEASRTRTRARLADLAKTLTHVDSSYMGHIDEVATNPTPQGLSVAVKGWVARRGGTHPAVKIVALCDALGTVISFTELFDRTDVRRAHQHINYPVGFNVTGLAPAGSDQEEVILVLVTDTGAVSCAVLKGGLKSVRRSTPGVADVRSFFGLPKSPLPFLQRVMNGDLKARIEKKTQRR
ncbi:hypothetical protein MZK49_29385 [Ensifer sesbaniae]|uniref:GT99 family glycosyltransferase N-terminal domain-containing protein n=1 Tax=Ensifer sesbaniae TaxID=1214071 RepID=UPI002000A5C6|nr:hypothetical protein [Ensifer sesbaniae]